MALPVERSRIDADGRGIAVVAAGSGQRTIVLVHGFGADHLAWIYNQPALAAAARVIALDLPGHGGSDADVGDGSLEVFAGTVAAAVEGLGLESVHLVGHSLGGAASLVAAHRLGARVERLTLIAPLGFSPTLDASFFESFVAMDDPDAALAALRRLVARPGLVGQQMAAGVLAAIRRPGARDALARIAAGAHEAGRQRHDLRPALSALSVPAQVIWGAADGILPPAGADGLPVPVTLVPDAGHMPQMEAARPVNRAIEGFGA